MSLSLSATGTNAADNRPDSGPAMSPTQRMSNLFDQIDTSSTGSITQSQFEQAFKAMNPNSSKATADAVWSKLDPNGTGQVSKQGFIDGMTTMMKQMRGAHHHHHAAEAPPAPDATTTPSLLDVLAPKDSATKTAATTDTVGTLINALA